MTRILHYSGGSGVPNVYYPGSKSEDETFNTKIETRTRFMKY